MFVARVWSAMSSFTFLESSEWDVEIVLTQHRARKVRVMMQRFDSTELDPKCHAVTMIQSRKQIESFKAQKDHPVQRVKFTTKKCVSKIIP